MRWKDTHDNVLVFVFMIVLFLLTVFALVRPIFSPTGGATTLIEELCEQDSDCEDGKVCCLFTGYSSGTCDVQESCETIRDTTADTSLPVVERPAPSNPEVYYGSLVAMLIAVVVMAVIFYKKRR